MVNVDQQGVDIHTSKIMEEKLRIEDFLTLIQIYMMRGEYEQAIVHCEHAVNSFKALVVLQNQSRHQLVNELYTQGFNVKVVKRSV